MVETPYVRVEYPDDYVSWTLDRPDRCNGLGPVMAETLCKLLQDLKCRLLQIPEDGRHHQDSPEPSLRHHQNHQIGQVKNPKLLLITAKPLARTQNRIWLAGGDLKELAHLKSPRDGEKFGGMISQFLYGLCLLPIPVLMVIDGLAIGGGAEFALGGDIRLASHDSQFYFKQADMGLPTGFGGTGRLVELVGLTRAQTLLYGRRRLNAQEALEMGIIHEVARGPDSLPALKEQWIDRLTSIDPLVFASQKKMFNLWRQDFQKSAMEEESRLFGSVWMNPTHRQKVEDFVHKLDSLSGDE